MFVQPGVQPQDICCIYDEDVTVGDEVFDLLRREEAVPVHVELFVSGSEKFQAASLWQGICVE
jgi:hypothetical protein